MSEKPECYHCTISVIAQKLVEGGTHDFKRLVGDLMQTAAEIIESHPDETAELAEFAIEHFAKCRKEARETFDGKAGINQPAAGRA